MVTSYTTIKVPDELLKEIEKLIKDHPELGYRNRSEFIIEAIRDRIILLKKSSNS
ncbi:ribbon-helix-helix domain-containing protein [Acidiplasma sp.]|uniref:ribbon-helix-helix domain-containing protein n=1 Tax=Acidiplasma sp. TaxID=1872114 RepID=UPI00258B8004|nr:ribbon-helix-helix domain-containing protein [Acidiplasma sp.]